MSRQNLSPGHLNNHCISAVESTDSMDTDGLQREREQPEKTEKDRGVRRRKSVAWSVSSSWCRHIAVSRPANPGEMIKSEQRRRARRTTTTTRWCGKGVATVMAAAERSQCRHQSCM